LKKETQKDVKKEDGWESVDKNYKEVSGHELDITDWKKKKQDEFVYPAGKGRFWK
jgi:hypothetical protein